MARGHQPLTADGALAQLVERCLCKADVRSSNLLGSTIENTVSTIEDTAEGAFPDQGRRPFCLWPYSGFRRGRSCAFGSAGAGSLATFP